MIIHVEMATVGTSHLRGKVIEEGKFCVSGGSLCNVQFDVNEGVTKSPLIQVLRG